MKITDRLTGEEVHGVVHGDDADCDLSVDSCPVCGAEGGEECSSPLGVALGAYVHIERGSSIPEAALRTSAQSEAAAQPAVRVYQTGERVRAARGPRDGVVQDSYTSVSGELMYTVVWDCEPSIRYSCRPSELRPLKENTP